MMPRTRQTRDETIDERLEGAGRKKRTPFGGPELKLNAKVRPGYVGRWFNDLGSRIHRAQEAGYDFVHEDTEARSDNLASRISQVVGSDERGNQIRAYLMEIPKEYYDEDQAAKSAEHDEIDATLRRGHVTSADKRDAEAFTAQAHGRGIVVETTTT